MKTKQIAAMGLTLALALTGCGKGTASSVVSSVTPPAEISSSVVSETSGLAEPSAIAAEEDRSGRPGGHGKKLSDRRIRG